MANLLSSVSHGEVVIEVDPDGWQRIVVPTPERLVMVGAHLTLTYPPSNLTADLAHAAIETLDAVDGINADKLERIPDA